MDPVGVMTASPRLLRPSWLVFLSLCLSTFPLIFPEEGVSCGIFFFFMHVEKTEEGNGNNSE